MLRGADAPPTPPDTPRHPPPPPTVATAHHVRLTRPPNPPSAFVGEPCRFFPLFLAFFQQKGGAGGGEGVAATPNRDTGLPSRFAKEMPLSSPLARGSFGGNSYVFCAFSYRRSLGRGGDARSQPISAPPPRHGCHHLSLPRSFPAPQSGIFCLPGAIMVVFLLCKLKIKKKRNQNPKKH